MGKRYLKKTSNHSEQRFLREEVLSFTHEKAKAFSLLFLPPAEGGGMEISMIMKAGIIWVKKVIS